MDKLIPAALAAIQLARQLIEAINKDELTDEQRAQLFNEGERLNAEWASLAPSQDG